MTDADNFAGQNIEGTGQHQALLADSGQDSSIRSSFRNLEDRNGIRISIQRIQGQSGIRKGSAGRASAMR